MGNCEMAGGGLGGLEDDVSFAHRPDVMKLTKDDMPLPFTERETFTLTKSWKTISKNMVNTGVIMFLK